MRAALKILGCLGIKDFFIWQKHQSDPDSYRDKI